MGFQTWVALLTRSRRSTTLVALITTFAGVGLLVDRPKGTILEWLSLPLLIFGGFLFVWALWPAQLAQPAQPTSVGSRFLTWLTFNGRLTPFFPAFAIGLIAADVAYNYTLSLTPAFQTEDTIVFLAAATLLGYNFVPSQFARERDFVLLFFLWLNAILVVPLLTARLYYEDFQKSVDIYSWVALAPQTNALLKLLGVNNQLVLVSGSSAPGLTFTPQHMRIQVTLVITTACSGIYSFGIFASAFISFVLTEHKVLSRRTWALLGLGLLTTYVANVLRMTVIVLVGYYTDTAQTDLQNMLIAHSYAGWLIFLGWVALFWGLTLKFLATAPPSAQETKPAPRKLGVRCVICSDALTPALPGYRCECGKIYHAACAEATEVCPKCNRQMKVRKTEKGSSPPTPFGADHSE